MKWFKNVTTVEELRKEYRSYKNCKKAGRT